MKKSFVLLLVATETVALLGVPSVFAKNLATLNYTNTVTVVNQTNNSLSYSSAAFIIDGKQQCMTGNCLGTVAAHRSATYTVMGNDGESPYFVAGVLDYTWQALVMCNDNGAGHNAINLNSDVYNLTISNENFIPAGSDTEGHCDYTITLSDKAKQ